MNERSEENDGRAPEGVEKQTIHSPKMNERVNENAQRETGKQTTGGREKNEGLEENAQKGTGKQITDGREKNEGLEENARKGNVKQTTDAPEMNETSEKIAQKQTTDGREMNKGLEENAKKGTEKQTTDGPEMNEGSEKNAQKGTGKQTTDGREKSEGLEKNAHKGIGKQITDDPEMNKGLEENATAGTQKQTSENQQQSDRFEENAASGTQKQTNANSKMNEMLEENASTGKGNQISDNPKNLEGFEENVATGTQNQTTNNSKEHERFEENAPMGARNQTTNKQNMSQRVEENVPTRSREKITDSSNTNEGFEENAPTMGTGTQTIQNPKTNENLDENARNGERTTDNPNASQRPEENTPAGTRKQTKNNSKMKESSDGNASIGSQKSSTNNQKMTERFEGNTRTATMGARKQAAHNQKTFERLEEDDRTALAGMSSSPPTRKPHSHSHCFRTSTGTHHKRQHQLRKHSLDENRILNHNPPTKSSAFFGGAQDTSDDEEFYPYSTVTANCGAAVGSMSDLHVNYRLGVGMMEGGGDEKLSQQPMPEFMGTGGGVGIFKVPTRAPVNPSRPPCVELRPHPLRETQVGKFLRTITSTETQLWAGQELGVRVWNYSDSYKPGTGVGGRASRGDEDAAPFYESTCTSPTICMVVDRGTQLVWSGHKDGKIRSWKMDQHFSDENGLKEGLCWQAHKGPVHTIEISPYGDIWSGSENGSIRVWPWEALEKCLSLSPEEKHMASLLMERSCIDLKNQTTVNGSCSIPSSDVKCLQSDYARAKIWVVGSLYFSIWEARTRELLKVFNIEGQADKTGESSSSSSSSQDQVAEDEMNAKLVSKSKKEKSGGFLQRSRNAIMGAADAVRRVATKGGSNEDGKRTEAIVFTADGMIWSGSSNGLLIQWDGNGNRLQDFTHHPCGVLCFCSHGSRIWVGYVSGMVQLLDLEGNLIAGWIAHNGPVIKLVVGNGFVFSLATHGGIRGWNISSPAPVDKVLRLELSEREIMYTRLESVRILVGTWNVGQGRASQDALMSWLGSTLSDVGIVVIGLQEVEMGAGFLAMSAAKETVGLEGSNIGQWWQDHIGKALDEGSTFERVGSRQLAGLMIAIWVRTTLRPHVGDLDVSAVACGLGRAIGNKGGVGLRLRVFDRIVCFVNCHLAAHLEAVNRRNADFDHIYRNMTFTRSSNLLSNAAAGVSSNAQMLRTQNAQEKSPDDGKPDLAEADMVIFCGDFNYRLFGISYDEARDFVSQRSFDWLREKDQLRAEMKAGKVFQGMREALIRFPPTYKFERGKPGLGGYDSGEKKRIPAWCDRVLYRDSRAAPSEECSLECPMVASILQYEARMDVTESDHKPVRCKFNVDIAHVDRSVRRQEYGKILEANDDIKSSMQALRVVPETNVNTLKLVLQNQETFNLRITNRSAKDIVFFDILCEGQSTIGEDEVASEYEPRGALSFPKWLEVSPGGGMIYPNQGVDVSVHHEEVHTLEEFVDGIPQSWWSEDTRDKGVILLVNVRGSCSTDTKTHRVHVRHCFSGSSHSSTEQKPNAPTCKIDKSNSLSSKSDSKSNSSSSKQDSKSNSSVSKKHSGSSHEKAKH